MLKKGKICFRLQSKRKLSIKNHIYKQHPVAQNEESKRNRKNKRTITQRCLQVSLVGIPTSKQEQKNPVILPARWQLTKRHKKAMPASESGERVPRGKRSANKGWTKRQRSKCGDNRCLLGKNERRRPCKIISLGWKNEYYDWLRFSSMKYQNSGIPMRGFGIQKYCDQPSESIEATVRCQKFDQHSPPSASEG